VHPKYLDSKGLVAVWREALLAQKVLQGNTKGYRNHPQLIRFREQSDPLSVLSTYLYWVYQESLERGYNFNESKIVPGVFSGQIPETIGQLEFEWEHLLRKLQSRDPNRLDQYQKIKIPDPHPLFVIIPGEIKDWEKVIR